MSSAPKNRHGGVSRRTAESSPRRAPRRRGGHRTTLTVPAELHRFATELAEARGVSANEVLVQLAEQRARQLEDEAERRRTVERRAVLVRDLLAGGDPGGDFPTALETQLAIDEARGRV